MSENRVLIAPSLLTNIGNAIRSKNGETGLYTPAQMAQKIAALIVVEPVYGEVVLDVNAISVKGGNTATFNVKLSEEPTQNQTVSIYADGVTISPASLTFTTTTWDTYQTVTVTTEAVDDDTIYRIQLVNSDPLMTETTLMLTVKGIGYEDFVDTTIPTEGRHILTADDFTSTNTNSGYIRLYGYNAEYTNVVVPATINGKIPWILCPDSAVTASNSTFAGNTTIQYVTFESNDTMFRDGGVTTGTGGKNMFKGCSALIGVSGLSTANVTNLGSAFQNCTNFRFCDNFDKLINVTNLNSTFMQCGIQYLQDLSALTKLANVQTMFKLAGIIKVFGFPDLNATSANGTNMYANCSGLTYAIVPKGVTNLSYGFYNDSALRRVDIFEDNIPASGINGGTAFYGCRNLTVYCNADTTTHASLLAAYGSSTQVTIKTFDGASAMPSIVVWGDSISSANKAWIEWPKRLQTKLGTSEYLVKNEAQAGEWSTSTTARQGGYAITTNAITIPADTTAVELTLTVNGAWTFSGGGYDSGTNAGIFSAGISFNPCTISGVQGTISRSGSAYYFTRLTAGAAVNVSAGTLIESDVDTVFNAADNVMIFYLNGNAGWRNDADTLLDMFQKAVDHFTDLGGTMYIVAGPAANSILTNATVKAEVLEFETKAATAFGNHWLNLREYEIQNGLTQNGLTASELDTQRMADGLVPASLVGGGTTTDIIMYDGVNNTDQNHPNAYGANTIMLAFYEKGKALGYWS